jgi:hypothetical protein
MRCLGIAVDLRDEFANLVTIEIRANLQNPHSKVWLEPRCCNKAKKKQIRPIRPITDQVITWKGGCMKEKEFFFFGKSFATAEWPCSEGAEFEVQIGVAKKHNKELGQVDRESTCKIRELLA